MAKAQPSTNPQRIATFAYFREHHEGSNRFAKADLRPYFGEAREPEPKNFDRDFNAAVKEGWIHEAGSDSYITATGIAAVEAGFGGKAKPRGATVPNKKRKKPSA